jgi:hypothetical protein
MNGGFCIDWCRAVDEHQGAGKQREQLHVMPVRFDFILFGSGRGSLVFSGVDSGRAESCRSIPLLLPRIVGGTY